MQYELVINFCNIHLIEVNVKDPQSAIESALKLFSQGRLRPEIRQISVFNIDDNNRPEHPIIRHTFD
jgi:hypothetical protein